MNPNKCPLSVPKTPVTTVVYRTIQDVIDHVIIPALKDANKNPDHYNITAFVNDWVALVDSTALNGYFNTARNIPDLIEEYVTATKARDLKVGDIINFNSVPCNVVAKSGEFPFKGKNYVALVLSGEYNPLFPTSYTMESCTTFKLIED